MEVNKKQLADIFGASIRTIQNWQEQGMPVLRGGGKGNEVLYDSAAVIKWYAERDAEIENEKLRREVEELRQASETDLQPGTIEYERHRLTRAQADAQELKNARDSAEVVETAFCTFVLSRIAGEIASILDGIPLSVQRRFPELENRHVDFLKRDIIKAMNKAAALDELIMAFRMSEQPRTIKIYNLLSGTNEFIGEGDAYIPPHTGLPANSTDIAPPDIPAGFVAVFNSDESSWHLVEDHRGKTVYDVASGDALFISELGSLPENVTWLSPEGEFQKWNGTAWVKDTEAEKLFRIREAEETKNSLMQVASEHIAPLQDAVDLEIATEEETLLLEAWKKYRVLLNRVDTSTAPDIEWPALP
ncbi:TPA: hypothetical protein JLJ58_003452 [Escherichia coli]|nr:hypothetical protein [Escherichia coli]EFD0852116.1 hypothetical protein [Escherichia coli]EFH6052999.1 hypothetical protein [Escherichia coli]HAW0536009.1 hypothetical protein [Escherichia coli]